MAKKNKKKKAEQQLKLKTAKYGAIAAWAIPALLMIGGRKPVTLVMG